MHKNVFLDLKIFIRGQNITWGGGVIGGSTLLGVRIFPLGGGGNRYCGLKTLSGAGGFKFDNVSQRVTKIGRSALFGNFGYIGCVITALI